MVSILTQVLIGDGPEVAATCAGSSVVYTHDDVTVLRQHLEPEVVETTIGVHNGQNPVHHTYMNTDTFVRIEICRL